MACSRFEYASISWSTMESNNTEQWWNLWSAAKTWEWLPPTQQLRHRRGGAAIFLGDGMTNIKYSLIHHDNMDLKPTWKLYLGTCFSFGRGKTGSLLSAMTVFLCTTLFVQVYS